MVNDFPLQYLASACITNFKKLYSELVEKGVCAQEGPYKYKDAVL